MSNLKFLVPTVPDDDIDGSQIRKVGHLTPSYIYIKENDSSINAHLPRRPL